MDTKGKKEVVKLHIAVDAKSKKVVSFRIVKGNVHGTRKFGPLVRTAAERHRRHEYEWDDYVGYRTRTYDISFFIFH